ncbi:MAG TPA: tRNA uridine-5-carboxymethylaminomethyl(34) synthesis GTPase MnmE [Alphaproteobacteria bacterium]|nr:tRNA uridine-5-carboxymethylaminomethyl(34) synthesis GTPase MnmE [Alphaproteobacteria bacterium]
MSGRGDTIFAPATAAGRAGVAVIRISGPRAGEALTELTGRLPQPRVATWSQFTDRAQGSVIDDGLALWFPAPRSFTGEDVAELHVHGSRAVLAALMALLGRLGLRLAEAGEFTRRAFDAGKLDLAQVEGLADLIAAETEAQRRQARRQLDGVLGAMTEGWRARLLRMLAHAEAEIDFPDEDLPGGLIAGLGADIDLLAAEIRAHLADARGERLREGLSIAILGPPNAGKSSLLNALARREAAIVSATAGTTRDVIEVQLDLGGYPVTVADTAGLRALPEAAEGHAAIESEGIRRALARAEAADLKLLVLDATAGEPDESITGLIDTDTLVVLNKIDAVPHAQPIVAGQIWRVSVKTGEGLPKLLDALSGETAKRLALQDGAAPLVTRARHRAALEECVAALERAHELTVRLAEPELVAEDLRLATRALGRITGRVAVDDILDVVFREFCIGK